MLVIIQNLVNIVIQLTSSTSLYNCSQSSEPLPSSELWVASNFLYLGEISGIHPMSIGLGIKNRNIINPAMPITAPGTMKLKPQSDSTN